MLVTGMIVDDCDDDSVEDETANNYTQQDSFPDFKIQFSKCRKRKKKELTSDLSIEAGKYNPVIDYAGAPKELHSTL